MEGIAGIQYREMNGVQIPVLEGMMSEGKMLASLNRYGRIAAQEMKRVDQAQYEMMLLSGKLMEKLMKIQTEAEEYHEKLAESLLKTWTREDRTDPYNTLEMTNLGYRRIWKPRNRSWRRLFTPGSDKTGKTEEDTEKGTASAVPFPSEEIEPAQPENWQKEQILLEMTEQEIPYKNFMSFTGIIQRKQNGKPIFMSCMEM
mgnify:CR=1 FL=1